MRPAVLGALIFILVGAGVIGLLTAWRTLGSSLLRTFGVEVFFGRGGRREWSRLVGNILLVVGLAILLLAGVAYVSDLALSGRELPRPVALQSAGAIGSEPGSPTPDGTSGFLQGTTDSMRPLSTELDAPTSPVPTATAAPTETVVPTVTSTPVKPGVPIRMVIPSIDVDSEVQEAGTYWENGQLQWQTLPWVVAHYRTTAQAGEKGNAVFSGHVISQNAGNVFRDLYKMELGDEVRVYTEENDFTYVVSNVREVLPTDVGVMDPTPDETVTLITCSGVWIRAEQSYSRRLIVTAKLKR